jgi:hypothetical protein
VTAEQRFGHFPWWEAPGEIRRLVTLFMAEQP